MKYWKKVWGVQMKDPFGVLYDYSFLSNVFCGPIEEEVEIPLLIADRSDSAASDSRTLWQEVADEMYFKRNPHACASEANLKRSMHFAR